MTEDQVCNWRSVGELLAAVLVSPYDKDPDKEAIRAASIAYQREIDDV